MAIRVLGVVAVFGLGVGIGCAAAPVVVPTASAQQTAQLSKWEYKCERNLDDDERNALGAERWEMVGIAHSSTSMFACFKRPTR